MRYLLFILMLLLTTGVSEAATQLTGHLYNPDGTGFTGTLLLSLSQQASIQTTGSCGGPALVVPGVQVKVSLVNSAITNGPINLYGSDCTQPVGVPYDVKGIDATGNVLFTDQWLITGSTQDLGAVVSVQPGPNGTLGVTSPIIGNPSGNQTIAQPTGTALTINNLTVTGTFIIPFGTTIAANSANVATQLATTPTNCTDINGNTGVQLSDGFLGFAVGITAQGNAICSQPNFPQIAGHIAATQITSDVMIAAFGFTPMSMTLFGHANGVATLDSNGLVPIAELPAAVTNPGGDPAGSDCALSGCTMMGEIQLPDDIQSGHQAVSANYVFNQIGPIVVTAQNAYSLALKAVQSIAVGAPNGVAPLDPGSLVPVTSLPYASATQDGIITAAQFTQFVTGITAGGSGGSVVLPVNSIPFQGALGTSPVAATVANLVALYHSIVISGGITTTTAPCNGVLQSDGFCGTITLNKGVAIDANGHLNTLGELQTTTDANGITTIACHEDHNKGIFDARCNRTERIDGNSTVVNINTNPPLALQQTLNDMNCWTQKHSQAAQLKLPPGIYQVGIPTQPTLTAGPGMEIEGTPSWGLSALSGSGGTILEGTYNNAMVFHAVASYTTGCFDGTTITNTAGGGKLAHLLVYGTGVGGGTNAPGDSNTYIAAGPSQVGMQVDWTQADVEDIQALNTGGSGVIALGADSEYIDLRAYNALTWYRSDRGAIGGVAYNPSTDSLHASIQLDTLDGRFKRIKTFGALIPPHSSGAGASELGHVCGVEVSGGTNIGGTWSGGTTTVDDIYEQADEMGICRSAGGGHGRISNFRAENNYVQSLYSLDDSTAWSNGVATAGCMDAASVTALGSCYDLSDASPNGDYWDNVHVYDNAAFGTSSRTSFVQPSVGLYTNVDGANAVPTVDTQMCRLNTKVFGVNAGTSQYGLFLCDTSVPATPVFHWTFYPMAPGTF